jgi:predicted transcriptional regulator
MVQNDLQHQIRSVGLRTDPSIALPQRRQIEAVHKAVQPANPMIGRQLRVGPQPLLRLFRPGRISKPAFFDNEQIVNIVDIVSVASMRFENI